MPTRGNIEFSLTYGTEALGALILHKWNEHMEGGEREKGLCSETQPLISGPEGGF